MFETNISGHNKILEDTKKLGALLPNAPRGQARNQLGTPGGQNVF